MDQTTIETTPTANPKEKSIRKGESFTFFSNQAKATLDEITESRQVEDIGILSGTASEQEVFGQKKWLIEFEIAVPPLKVKEVTSEPVQGEPGENLVMFATLKSSSPVFTQIEYWASLGQIKVENGKRTVIFDKWHQVDLNTSKTQVMTFKEPGNSLTPPDDSYVRYSEFVLR